MGIIGKRTQVGLSGIGAGKVQGFLSVGIPVAQAVLTPVHLSTEGTIDWLAMAEAAFSISGGDYQLDSSVYCHSKLMGGYMRRSFEVYGSSGTFAISSPADSVWQRDSVQGDDACLGKTLNNNLLAASVIYPQLQSNNINPYSHWGFKWRMPCSTAKSRQMNVYFSFASGGASLANQLNINARLGDLSAPDVTRTLNTVVLGKSFYVVPIVFRSTEPCDLHVSLDVIMNVGDAACNVGHHGVTVF